MTARAEPDADAPGGRIVGAAAGLRSAIAFLTLIPLPLPDRPDGGFRDAPGWFPLVGAAIGALGGAVRVATQPLVGSAAGTVLAMIALVGVTGALHLDGLADTADGLGVREDRDRRLSVMRDSANGTFGTLALGLWGLLMFSVLAPLSAGQALRALIAAAACGRLAAVLHGSVLGPARPDGLGSAFAPGRVAVATAAATTVAASLLALGLGNGAVALGASLVTGLGFTEFARRAFGGQTGDTLGAAVVIAETVAAAAALAMFHA